MKTENTSEATTAKTETAKAGKAKAEKTPKAPKEPKAKKEKAPKAPKEVKPAKDGKLRLKDVNGFLATQEGVTITQEVTKVEKDYTTSSKLENGTVVTFTRHRGKISGTAGKSEPTPLENIEDVKKFISAASKAE